MLLTVPYVPLPRTFGVPLASSTNSQLVTLLTSVAAHRVIKRIIADLTDLQLLSHRLRDQNLKLANVPIIP